jgi:hypothetical protein
MANSYFNIHNGLQVGGLSIDAANGNITTTGTIVSTGAVPASFAANVYFLGNIFFSTDGAQIFGNDTDGPLDPAYTWIADKNTGIFNPSTGVVGITSQGTEYFRVAASGNTWISQTTQSTSSTSGALTVTGGVGIGSNLFVGGNTTVTNTLAPISNASVNLGTTTAYWNNVYAVNFLGTSTTAKYADLAECYTSDAEYEPGTVLDFGGESEVTISSIDASTAVAGVVSTAPAYLMNSGLENITQVQLALTGRVPCKVTGTVRQGQMMVSNGDGTARAETNPVLGSVIGKALENFDGETGVIEVVVGRL